MYRLRTLLAVAAALALLPAATTAQVGGPGPLPADVEGIEAALRDVASRLDAINQTMEERSAAARQERLDATSSKLDSAQVGPFHLVAFREDLDHARELVAEAWAPYARLDRHAAWLANVRLVAQTSGDRRQVVTDRGDVWFFYYPDSETSTDASIRDVMTRLLRQPMTTPRRGTAPDVAFASWVGAPLSVRTSTRTVWLSLVRSSSPTGVRCVDGDVLACMAAMDLHPDGMNRSVDRAERLRLFLGLDTREQVVDYLAAMDQRVHVTYRAMTGDGRSFLDACIRDWDAEPPEGVWWSCSSAFNTYAMRALPSRGQAGLYAPRHSLLNYALDVGPDGGFERIAEAVADGASVETILERLSGVPLDQLVRDWWTRELGEYRPESGGPGSTRAPGAVFWAGFFVVFSFLSTRRRFG